MKTAKILLSIAILGLAMNLSASVRINALGSYFEYLIPDTETDIELFPTHLGMINNNYIQINNSYPESYSYIGSKNLNFSFVPLASRLCYRINLDIASNNYEPRTYLDEDYNNYSTNFYGREYGAALVNNSLSYKFSESFHLGYLVKYGIKWKEYDDESIEMENPEIIINQVIEDNDYDDDYYAARINFRFISDYNLDISLNYSKNDIEDIELSLDDYEQVSLFYGSLTERNDTRLENLEVESEDYGFALLVETTSNKSTSRYFFESHYIETPTKYSYDISSQRLRYENEELTNVNIDSSSKFKIEDMNAYSVSMGFGKTLTKEKIDIYYGAKFYGSYSIADRIEHYTDIDFSQNIYPDTTYTDSVSISGWNLFEIEDWKVALEIPFGVSYKLNDNVQFLGGLGMKLIRQEFEYFDDNDFSRWVTDRYVSCGASISPFECLKCDINFGHDFAGFSGWQLDLKYLW